MLSFMNDSKILFTWYRGETDWPVVLCFFLEPFLKMGDTLALFPSSGSLPSLADLVYIRWSGTDSLSAHYFSTLVWIPSIPGDLSILRSLSFAATSWIVKWASSICWSLFTLGSSVGISPGSSFVKTDFKKSLSTSASLCLS